MTTQLQIVSNQQNAQLSTGPKNTSKTSQNAKKYGIFSNELIINCKYYKEDPQELEILKEEFYQEYDPMTATERELVNKLIETTWKLRRINKARNAIAIEEMEKVEFDTNRRVDEVQELRYVLSKNLEDSWEYRTDEQVQKLLNETMEKRDDCEFDEMNEKEINENLSLYAILAKIDIKNIENLSIEEKKKLLLETLDKVYNIQEKPLKDQERKKKS